MGAVRHNTSPLELGPKNVDRSTMTPSPKSRVGDRIQMSSLENRDDFSCRAAQQLQYAAPAGTLLHPSDFSFLNYKGAVRSVESGESDTLRVRDTKSFCLDTMYASPSS